MKFFDRTAGRRPLIIVAGRRSWRLLHCGINRGGRGMPRVNLSDAVRQIHRLFGEGTLAGLTDAQLLERHVSHGDELAFMALVQRHGPMVLAVCCGVLNDSNDADDAFQAVFLVLAARLDRSGSRILSVAGSIKCPAGSPSR